MKYIRKRGSWKTTTTNWDSNSDDLYIYISVRYRNIQPVIYLLRNSNLVSEKMARTERDTTKLKLKKIHLEKLLNIFLNYAFEKQVSNIAMLIYTFDETC